MKVATNATTRAATQSIPYDRPITSVARREGAHLKERLALLMLLTLREELKWYAQPERLRACGGRSARDDGGCFHAHC